MRIRLSCLYLNEQHFSTNTGKRKKRAADDEDKEELKDQFWFAAAILDALNGVKVTSAEKLIVAKHFE